MSSKAHVRTAFTGATTEMSRWRSKTLYRRGPPARHLGPVQHILGLNVSMGIRENRRQVLVGLIMGERNPTAYLSRQPNCAEQRLHSHLIKRWAHAVAQSYWSENRCGWRHWKNSQTAPFSFPVTKKKTTQGQLTCLFSFFLSLNLFHLRTICRIEVAVIPTTQLLRAAGPSKASSVKATLTEGAQAAHL